MGCTCLAVVKGPATCMVMSDPFGTAGGASDDLTG